MHHRPTSVFIAVLCCLLLLSNSRASETGVLSAAARERVVRAALSALPPASIPTQYRTVSGETSGFRCATAAVSEARRYFDTFSLDQQAVLAQVLERPANLPQSRVTPNGQVRIHYTTTGGDAVSSTDANSNGVPDFIDGVLDAFENSYNLETGPLKFQLPPGDGGVDGAEYDVYVRNLGRGIYGFTVPEVRIAGTPQNDATSFIQIDNDFGLGFFSKGQDGVKVAAAHELLHGIQFGYRDAFFSNEYFYFELCSSWMEDVIYDEVNDYYSSVPGYLGRTTSSFNQYERSTSFNYGAAIWNRYLVKRFGDIDVVRRSWEKMRSGLTVLQAIDAALADGSVDFDDAFAEFAVWNYFTGSRSDTVRSYREGANYPLVPFAVDKILHADTTLVDSARSLSYRYYRLTTSEAGDYRFNGSVGSVPSWRFGVIVTPSGGLSSSFVFKAEQGASLGFLPALSSIVVVPVNLDTLSGADQGALQRTFTRYTFSLQRAEPGASIEKGITSIYPNPFVVNRQARMTVDFLPEATSRVEVRILSSGGSVIRSEVFPKAGSANATSFSWDGTDDGGQPVASGVYLVELRQGDFVQFRKFAVIRE